MSDRAPDVLGEITAWRAWKVIGNEPLPMLASVTHAGTIWHPAHWTLATCGQSPSCRNGSIDGGVPGEECSCGLYAARDRRHLVNLGYNAAHGDEVVFIGEVGLAGKVIPGTQGWRAEKGRIQRLYVPFHHWRYVEPLKRLYRVPVVLDNTSKAEPTLGR